MTFLSEDAVTSNASSEEISIAITGSLCPYMERKNFNCGGKKNDLAKHTVSDRQIHPQQTQTWMEIKKTHTHRKRS